MENQVYLITSTYMDVTNDWMISGIWGPNGDVLAQAKEWGTVAITEVDLNEHPMGWRNVSDFRARIPFERPQFK